MINVIKNKWKEVINYVLHEYDISNISYETWLTPLEPCFLEKAKDSSLILHISFKNIDDIDDFFISYVDTKFNKILCASIDMVLDIKCNIIFDNKRMERSNIPSFINDDKKNIDSEVFQNANINPKYKFENFIIGPSNEMAHATSLAVSKSLGDIYNPLFLYSGPGLGKTHLMHSIANSVLERNPQVKVLYVTSEKFTNELIESIRTNTSQKFRDKYRNLDMLLIDDIQFIINKESTQEEFFHTFNTLYDRKKQIIISSDKPPKDLKTLDERLTSRFEWGITVDIMPPNYETRMAILEKKQENDGIYVGKEVLQYIATHIKSNIRELEGALNKIIATSKLLNNKKIDLNMAQESLKGLINPDIPIKLNIEAIVTIVAQHFNIPKSDIISKKKPKEISVPRHIAVYLCRELTDSTLVEIGKFLNNRDHSTILNSIKYVEKNIENKDDFILENINVIKKKLSPS